MESLPGTADRRIPPTKKKRKIRKKGKASVIASRKKRGKEKASDDAATKRDRRSRPSDEQSLDHQHAHPKRRVSQRPSSDPCPSTPTKASKERERKKGRKEERSIFESFVA